MGMSRLHRKSQSGFSSMIKLEFTVPKYDRSETLSTLQYVSDILNLDSLFVRRTFFFRIGNKFSLLSQTPGVGARKNSLVLRI